MKERKELFVCKLYIRDGNVFFAETHKITTIRIFTCSYIKKSLKKCLGCFNKTFSNYYCVKTQASSSQSEHRDRLRVRWKRWKELMIMLVYPYI